MYQTPGVYVKEISTLPPSVAEVSTAIPAFIGNTEKGTAIKRISTLLEYEENFGGAKSTSFNVKSRITEDGQEVVDSVVPEGVTGGQPEYLMYYCLSHYFKNGGGPCYIVPAGDYSAVPSKAGFDGAIDMLAKEDEPTLIVLTDAVKLPIDDYYAVCTKALGLCADLGDRFTIIDVHGDNVQGLRDNIGMNDLMYGAAYYPHLKTTLSFLYDDELIKVESSSTSESAPVWSRPFGDNGIIVNSTAPVDATPEVKIVGGDGASALEFTLEGQLLTIRNVTDKVGTDVIAAWTTWRDANDAGGFDIEANGDGSGAVPNTSNRNENLELPDSGNVKTLAELKVGNTGLYNKVKATLLRQKIVLPPSAAMAGIYASVDRKRGVWKAPANVSLSSVTAPVSKTTDETQKGLNVDPVAGKSVNAIRTFTGKGTLVWGARTLAGNDNEWRYVSVRRLFNMIEESVQKSTAFAVFEANDSSTWMKVKGMIESFLFSLWQRGALAGPTPDSAYFVNVGLGTTMTAQDILEGRMNVEIGIAAVRPAEFIILRFSHKLQEA